jgi:hypothetical protein
MSDRQQLTPPTSEGASQWKAVGLELATHRCTFCGGPTEATLGCPDEAAPLIFQVSLLDCVIRRFRELKHGRMVQLARDMTSAAGEIREARRRFKSERFERRFDDEIYKRPHDPARRR